MAELPITSTAWFNPGHAGTPHGLVTNDYNTIQPRVGFSYDLTGAGKTILRGGFGIFYERLQGNDIYGLANSNLPFEYTPSASNVYFSAPTCSWESTASTANPANCGNPLALPIFAAGLTSIDTKYPAPGAAMYSLGVQHELQPSVIAVVQYVGNLGYDQNDDIAINNFPLNTSGQPPRRLSASGTGLPGATYPAGSKELYTYAGYAGISQETNNTNNTYNGLQASLRLQNKWGLSGELDYTYSHNIDITDTDLATVANPWNMGYEKGNSGYDRRQMFQGNYIYSLPIFNKSQGLVHSLLGGWQVAGTFVDETGEPVSGHFWRRERSYRVGRQRLHQLRQCREPNSLPSQVQGLVRYLRRRRVCQLAQDPLAPPTPGYAGGPNLGFGDGHKDTFIGPGRVDFTTSLYKSFAMTERAHFEFRAESYNTFNHTEFNSINSSYSTGGNYGQATGDWGPRVLQLGAKMVF